MDRQMASRLDAWLTREPPWDDFEALRCLECGWMLYMEPDHVKVWEEREECDGKLKHFVCDYDERTVEILGDEYRGKTYRVYYFDCGAWTGRGHDVKADTPGHEPHSDVVAGGVTSTHVCPNCGHHNIVGDY